MFRKGCIHTLTALLLLLCPPLLGHELNIARLSVSMDEAGNLSLKAAAPGLTTLPAPVLPEHCRLLGGEAAVQGASQFHWLYTCTPADQRLTGQLSLAWPLEGVYLEQGDDSRFIDSSGGAIEIPLNEILLPGRSAGGSASSYLWFGGKHILGGWDHLAFVALLCLLARGLALVKLITAFTLGHSVTLALATLDIVQLPAAPTEACIALSIMYMAREVLCGTTQGERYGLVLAFGLLHGLGFASALRDFGLAGEAVFLPLLSFNIGVELGQLVFVAALVVISVVVSRFIPQLSPLSEPHARSITAWCIGGLGGFWTVERVAGFMAS